MIVSKPSHRSCSLISLILGKQLTLCQFLTRLWQGFLICDITGCCVRGISFSEHEYIDTMGVEASAKRCIDVAPFVHRAPVCSWDNTRSVPLSRHAGRWGDHCARSVVLVGRPYLQLTPITCATGQEE